MIEWSINSIWRPEPQTTDRPSFALTDLVLTLPAPDPADAPASVAPVQLRLDDIVLWRTTLAELRTVAGAGALGPDRLDLSAAPVARRLESGARLRLASLGVRFHEAMIEIALDDAAAPSQVPPSATPLASQSLAGSALLEALGLGPSGPGPALPRDDSAETRMIAFYLPQFYPFEENDSWWGEGFTEWANVLDAKPQFAGHAMPLLPADLGCYDLRLPAVRARQAKLAQDYGIDGFCYYYYWFSGRRLMQTVLEDILHSGVPATPFCLCWANETWSRRWDGGTKDVLMQQDHDPDIDVTMIQDLLPYFTDPRYITVEGAPVFLVYRLDIMNEPARVFAAWKHAAQAAGLPGLFIVAARTFALDAQTAALADAVVDFPPHFTSTPNLRATLDMPADYTGCVFDYRAALVNAMAAPASHAVSLPGIMPRWDNTARTGRRANIFINSSPNAFRLAVRMALDLASALPPSRRMVFINSWNEWGEGAMLEPDRLHGHAYLEALRQARGGYTVAPDLAARFTLLSALRPEASEAWLTGFAADTRMVGALLHRLRLQSAVDITAGPPAFLARLSTAPRLSGHATFDWTSIGQDLTGLVWPRDHKLQLRGWAVFDPSRPHPARRVAYLLFTDLDSDTIAYHTVIHSWMLRQDVAAHLHITTDAESRYFGFDLELGAASVAPGQYAISLVQTLDGAALITPRAASLVRL